MVIEPIFTNVGTIPALSDLMIKIREPRPSLLLDLGHGEMLQRLKARVYLVLQVALLLSIGVACAQNSSAVDSMLVDGTQNSRKMNEELRLKFTALAKPPVGFGYTFACTVQTDLVDRVGPKTFIMTVLLEGKAVLQQLNQAPAGRVFEGEFRKYEDHVEYNMMPITGFVDQDRTAWKLSQLK